MRDKKVGVKIEEKRGDEERLACGHLVKLDSINPRASIPVGNQDTPVVPVSPAFPLGVPW
jgi:hypothetical protein